MALNRLASNVLKPLKNNFVERPWGGMRIREHKGFCALPDQIEITGAGLGEAFEIAAYDADDEARRYPSRIRFTDGSELSLPRLLEQHADALLGPEFVRRYGRTFPLLPKTLDIAELLSVQAHPEGHTEVYVIIDAEPGATIRLGFSADVDAAAFKRELAAGRHEQQALLDVLGPTMDATALQRLLKSWFARRPAAVRDIEAPVRAALEDGSRWPAARESLDALKRLYWKVLDMMNVLPVAPGQVIHNANPARIVSGTGRAPSAEVHALGNPEGREVLALEIRRPGPTLRAWDNVRFPVRDVDIGAAVDALNLRRTIAEEFIAEPQPVAGRPGVLCSVDSEFFRIEHLHPRVRQPVDVPASPPHCLHALRGAATLRAAGGAVVGQLARGESALVPVAVGAYRVTVAAAAAELVKVTLPDGA